MKKSLYTEIIRSPSLTWDKRTDFLVLLTEFGGNPYLMEINRSPIEQLSFYVKHNTNNEGAQSLAALTALLSTSRQNAYYESLPLALKYAALSGNMRVDIIESYIGAGHDINEPISNGHNLLTYSVLDSKDSTEFIQYLLDNGADVNHINPSSGQTPLQMAISNKYSTVASLLIERGANVSNIDKKGRTGLHLAAAHGQKDLAKRLIELGEDTDITDRRGQTALHYAAHYGHYEISRYLIEADADTTITDNDGRDALWRSNNSHIPDESTINAFKELIEDSHY
jgi:ankyrin repeat protein